MTCLWTKEVKSHGIEKSIKVLNSDILDVKGNVDLLVCSAYKGHYGAYQGTLIGNLKEKKQISVEKEAETPVCDCREQSNFWISKELDGDIRRIGCIELLDISYREHPEDGQMEILKNSFSNFYEMLEKMEIYNLPMQKVVLPVLGTGNQRLEAGYVIPPLLEQCVRALQKFPKLKEIILCERNEVKAVELVKGLRKAEEMMENVPNLFISYCSAQRECADSIRNLLEEKGIACWMAPYSIPTGSSYQAEIPAALSKISNVLLILSEEAEKSRWVQKEVGSTIGARHTLIPYKNASYEHSQQFTFLLDGEQIYEADESLPEAERYVGLVNYLLERLGVEKKQKSETQQILEKLQVEQKGKRKTILKHSVSKRCEKIDWPKLSALGIGILILLQLVTLICSIMRNKPIRVIVDTEFDKELCKLRKKEGK